jgi:2-polyprenyl-3-methyl-5-hydroxy-6-metoxy-1,4-benzoquinol methylase
MTDPLKPEVLADQFRTAGSAADFLAIWLNHPLLSEANQKILDDYYRNFAGMCSPRIRYWYNRQLAEAEELIRSNQRLRVLEIGVGTGTEFLWWAFLGADVTGIDAFQHCLDVVAERRTILEGTMHTQLNCRLHLKQITEFEDDAGFDLIWLEQAFHHLEPRTEVLKRISALLRPGGKVIFSEANALNPLLQLLLIRQRGFKKVINVDTAQGKLMWGNERVLSRGSLARLLKAVGIDQESSSYYRMFPASSIFDVFFGIERSIETPWLAPIYTHYNLVGRKAAK